MKIVITEEMIANQSNGVRCRTCPVAQALNAILRVPYYSMVSPGTILIVTDETVDWKMETNSEIVDFIYKVDHFFLKGNQRPEPCSFELPIPSNLLKE